MPDEASSQQPSWFNFPNPLLDRLPVFTGLGDFADALAFDPLQEIQLKDLSVMDRLTLLDGEKVPLSPTSQSLQAATVWYGMLMSGLKARNPIITENKKNYWEILNAADQGKLPASPTSGMSVNVTKGPTGTGKTVTQHRFCACFPQVIQHSNVESAGWLQLRQLVYLCVEVSHDGTRGGFLHGILLEMDRVLGTHYSEDLPKRHKSIERLAVATIARLHAHYTGIVFVDEGQLRNLVHSPQGELMQMFLLLLMNSGIPLVLVGNERAFDWVTYSQDQSRLTLTQPSIFAPICALSEDSADLDWEAMMDGVISFYVLLSPVTGPEECKAVLRQCSGGIAREALKLWTMAQRTNILKGVETVRPDDIKAAYNSRSYAPMRPLVDGFSFRRSDLLQMFPDVDHKFYAALWDNPEFEIRPSTNQTKNNKDAVSETKQNSQKRTRTTTEQQKFKSEQTRKRNEEARRQNLQKTLNPEDMRTNGLIKQQLAGLEATRKVIEAESDS